MRCRDVGHLGASAEGSGSLTGRVAEEAGVLPDVNGLGSEGDAVQSRGVAVLSGDRNLAGKALRLQGGQSLGVDPDVVQAIARQIAAVVRTGVEVAVVMGGGNFFRGAELQRRGMDRARADYMGMLGIVMNCLALQDFCEREGAPAPRTPSCAVWGIDFILGRARQPSARRKEDVTHPVSAHLVRAFAMTVAACSYSGGEQVRAEFAFIRRLHALRGDDFVFLVRPEAAGPRCACCDPRPTTAHRFPPAIGWCGQRWRGRGRDQEVRGRSGRGRRARTRAWRFRDPSRGRCHRLRSRPSARHRGSRW